MGLWNGYEQLELRSGSLAVANSVAERAARDKLVKIYNSNVPSSNSRPKKKKSKEEMEMMRWDKKRKATWDEGGVWIGEDGSIKGKMPAKKTKKHE